MHAEKYIYDGREWSRDELGALFLQSRDNMASRAVATIQMVEGDVILDVGCGAGLFSYSIAKKAKKVVGVDILPSSIEIAKEFNTQPNVEYIEGDLFKLHFPDGSFDCILFLETIEHVDNPVMFIREFHRLLKKGGHLIISTPNAMSYTNIVYAFSHFSTNKTKAKASSINKETHNTGTQQDHIYLWDFETLYRLLNRNGFSYIEHSFKGFGPITLNVGRRHLNFPFWTKKETKLMSLLKPFGRNIIIKVRKMQTL